MPAETGVLNSAWQRARAFVAGGTLRRDVVSLYAIQALAMAPALLTNVVTARKLGPADKGIADLFTLLSSFIVDLGLLGLGSGFLYYLANRGRSLSEVHGTGLAMSALAGVVACLVGWLALPVWHEVFLGLPNWAILLCFGLAPLFFYRQIFSSLLMGLNAAVLGNKIALYIALAGCAATVVLWRTGHLTVEAVILLTAALTLVHVVIGAIILFRRDSKLSVSWPLAGQALTYGLTIYFGNVFNIIHFRIDQVMVNRWMGSESVGLYALSVRWAEMLFLLDNAIMSAALFKISSLPPDESRALTKRLFKTQLIISGSAGLLLAAIAWPLVHYMYGSAYDASVLPLVLLIPGMIFWSAAKLCSVMLSYNLGQGMYCTVAAGLGVVINALINLFVLMHTNFGINGVSVASSVSYAAVSALVIWRVFWSSKGRRENGALAKNEPRGEELR